MNKPTLGAGSLALVGLLFIGIMLLANTLLRGAQIDLTQDRSTRSRMARGTSCATSRSR